MQSNLDPIDCHMGPVIRNSIGDQMYGIVHPPDARPATQPDPNYEYTSTRFHQSFIVTYSWSFHPLHFMIQSYMYSVFLRLLILLLFQRFFTTTRPRLSS